MPRDQASAQIALLWAVHLWPYGQPPIPKRIYPWVYGGTPSRQGIYLWVYGGTPSRQGIYPWEPGGGEKPKSGFAEPRNPDHTANAVSRG